MSKLSAASVLLVLLIVLELNFHANSLKRFIGMGPKLKRGAVTMKVVVDRNKKL